MVPKFGIYLSKKLKVDDFSLLASKIVNFLLQLRQMKFLNEQLLPFIIASYEFG
jgi:hypothetical protein